MYELMTLKETLALLKISRATLYRLMEDGLPSIGTGRLRRFERDRVLRWWAAGETPRDGQAPPPPTLPPGRYACHACRVQGTLREPRPTPPRCPRCGQEAVRVGEA